MGRQVEMGGAPAPEQKLLPKDDEPGHKRTIDIVHISFIATGILCGGVLLVAFDWSCSQVPCDTFSYGVLALGVLASLGMITSGCFCACKDLSRSNVKQINV